MFVMACATPCRFLGGAENQPKIKPEKTQINSTSKSEEKPEENNAKEAAAAAWCSSCNAEMSQVRTKFRIDRCEEEEELPVIVYLCPKCGKIDLKADEKLNKNKSFKVD